MKRKLFSAILFGALLTASTSGLTSCKDYDDDISNLQSQIDKLATKEELQQKANELSTAISNAQSAADAAKKVAEDAAAAAKGAASDADAAKKAAAAAQTAADNAKAAADKAQGAADNAQAAADAVAADLKKAVENAASQIQEAVKNLATKDEVTAAVKVVADKYDAQAKELKALSDRLDKVEAKLGLGEGGEDIDLTEIQAELEDIEDAFEALVGVVSDMVTSVELVYCSDHSTENDLDFTIVTEQKNETFGKDVATEILTTANGQTRFESADVLVRVNPVDAEISASDVSLINSKGEELTGLVEATKVERYSDNNYMTRAAGANTGLWKITYAPVTGAKATDLNKKFSTDSNNPTAAGSYIVYAVAVKSAISDSISANRRVVSAYDITMKTTPAVAYNGDPTTGVTNQNLFKANDKSIDKLQNRYSTVNGITNTLTSPWPSEYVWKTTGGSAAQGPAVTPVYPGASGTVNTVLGDDRDANTGSGTHKLLVVKPGDDIKIKFDENIKGFYVALDYKFALDKSTASDPSEINAWNSYQYEGIANLGPDGKVIGGQKATMFKGKEGVVRVSSLRGEVTNDIIGLRVFAMNLDGTLLDPDGVAFYVNVGESGSDIELTAQNVTVVTPSTSLTGGQTINGTQTFSFPEGTLSGATAIDWTATKVGANSTTGTVGTDYVVKYHVKGAAANTYVTFTAATSSTNVPATYDGVVIYLSEPTTFEDDATYTFKGVVKKETTSGNDYVWKNMIANVTKKLPQTCPGFTWNVGQDEEQVMKNANMTYAANAKDGTLELNRVFVMNDANNSAIQSDNKFIFYLANSAYDADDNVVAKEQAYDNTNKYNTTIKADFIDGTTAHAVSSQYNYKKITSQKKDGAFIDYKVTSSSGFSIKYMPWSLQGDKYMGYNWYSVTKKWDGTNVSTRTYNIVKIQGTMDDLDLKYVRAKFGSKITPDLQMASLSKYITTNWLHVDEVYYEAPNNAGEVIKSPYYTLAINSTTGKLSFTKKTTVVDVPEHSGTLVIKVSDLFHHQETIKLPIIFNNAGQAAPTGGDDCTA